MELRKEAAGVDPDNWMSNAWRVRRLNDSLINMNSTAAQCHVNNLKVPHVTHTPITDDQVGHDQKQSSFLPSASQTEEQIMFKRLVLIFLFIFLSRFNKGQENKVT